MKIYWSDFEEKYFFENPNGGWDWFNTYYQNWTTMCHEISYICDAEFICEVSDD